MRQAFPTRDRFLPGGGQLLADTSDDGVVEYLDVCGPGDDMSKGRDEVCDARGLLTMLLTSLGLFTDRCTCDIRVRTVLARMGAAMGTFENFIIFNCLMYFSFFKYHPPRIMIRISTN